MMSNAPAKNDAAPAVPGSVDDETMWRLVASGDLSGLTDAQKSRYYLMLCDSLGINKATAPFQYMKLNGQLVLYAKRTATDQLRKLHGVSIVGKPVIVDDGEYITAEVTVQDATGRTDFEIGSVWVGKQGGEARANAMMKALTKAKRRATLSICGLGMLDETEVETIPGAKPWQQPGFVERADAVFDGGDERQIDDAAGAGAGASGGAPASKPRAKNRYGPLHKAIEQAALNGGDGISQKDLHGVAHDLACAAFEVGSLSALSDEQLNQLTERIERCDAGKLDAALQWSRKKIGIGAGANEGTRPETDDEDGGESAVGVSVGDAEHPTDAEYAPVAMEVAGDAAERARRWRDG